VMFAEVGYVQPPAFSPGDGKFAVGSLPGASCKLTRLAVSGDNHTRQSTAFLTGADGWAYVLWGASWTTVSNVTMTFYATCTAASPDNRTAKSANVNALWPPKAPSPSPT
jgi:hypothetical protein